MACSVHILNLDLAVRYSTNFNWMENKPQMETLKARTKLPELDNAGFTLLEIIAVIVIMSILAVVAVPRYFDLQSQARDRAMATGVAEGIGRVNGYFAQQILAGVTPGQIAYTNETIGTDLGDFTLTITGGGIGGANTFTITVAGNSGTPLANMTRVVSVRRPGGL